MSLDILGNASPEISGKSFRAPHYPDPGRPDGRRLAFSCGTVVFISLPLAESRIVGRLGICIQENTQHFLNSNTN